MRQSSHRVQTHTAPIKVVTGTLLCPLHDKLWKEPTWKHRWPAVRCSKKVTDTEDFTEKTVMPRHLWSYLTQFFTQRSTQTRDLMAWKYYSADTAHDNYFIKESPGVGGTNVGHQISNRHLENQLSQGCPLLLLWSQGGCRGLTVQQGHLACPGMVHPWSKGTCQKKRAAHSNAGVTAGYVNAELCPAHRLKSLCSRSSGP